MHLTRDSLAADDDMLRQLLCRSVGRSVWSLRRLHEPPVCVCPCTTVRQSSVRCALSSCTSGSTTRSFTLHYCVGARSVFVRKPQSPSAVSVVVHPTDRQTAWSRRTPDSSSAPLHTLWVGIVGVCCECSVHDCVIGRTRLISAD